MALLKAAEILRASTNKSFMQPDRLSTKSVVIVESDLDFAHTLAAGINATQEFQVIRCCDNVSEAVQSLQIDKPMIVFIDIEFNCANGLEGIRSIRAINRFIQIIVLTNCDSKMFAFQALSSGACAYIMKSTGLAEIIDALREVVRSKLPVLKKARVNGLI